MMPKKRTAFITPRKGFCYLTIKSRRRNFDLMRIRNYKIEAEEKRDVRRRYPDVEFDWKKLAEQLSKKKLVCRSYRARKRAASAPKPPHEPFVGVIDHRTKSVYVNDLSNLTGVGTLLDAIIAGKKE